MERSEASFVHRYLQKVAATKSILCVGLDPTREHVPYIVERDNTIEAIEGYLSDVIYIASSLVPVIKPQIAYYSALGAAGEEMLARLIAHAKSLGLLVILDAKRADIGETMEQYGNEAFERYNADACTSVVSYFGPTFNPSWMKWLAEGRMIIPMIRTSNSEAAMVQDFKLVNGLLLYEQVAQFVGEWNLQTIEATDGAGGVGGVVGATWPEQAVKCRDLTGDDVFFLIPGYGAQGGGADGAVGGLPNSRGELMGTVNSSRGITLTSWFDRETGQAREGRAFDHVEAAIKDANADLNAALERKLGAPMAQLIRGKR